MSSSILCCLFKSEVLHIKCKISLSISKYWDIDIGIFNKIVSNLQTTLKRMAILKIIALLINICGICLHLKKK